MLINTNIANSHESAMEKIDHVLTSGKAAELFNQMIAELGGPTDFIDNPWESMTKASVIEDVLASEHGYISAMQTRDIGMAVVGMKGGRIANGQKIDHSVGFDRILPLGTLVNKGDVIARVHANDKNTANNAKIQYEQACTLSDSQPEIQPVIHKII